MEQDWHNSPFSFLSINHLQTSNLSFWISHSWRSKAFSKASVFGTLHHVWQLRWSILVWWTKLLQCLSYVRCDMNKAIITHANHFVFILIYYTVYSKGKYPNRLLSFEILGWKLATRASFSNLSNRDHTFSDQKDLDFKPKLYQP